MKEMRKSNRVSRISSTNLFQAKQYRLPRIMWEIPSKFVLASDWYVVSGEDSEEKAVQKLRESTVLEALYHHSSTIPHNPFFPPDIENQYYDDRQTPLIPIIPIEEAESTTAPPSNLSTVLQHPVAEGDASLASVAAVIAIMKSMDPKSFIDTDLLIKIPSDPTMSTKLINKYRLETDNISIPSESNMPENAQLSLPRMPAGDDLSRPVSKPSMFLSLKEDHGGHDHARNARVAARTDPLMKKTIRDYGLPDNLQRNNNPATESLLSPVHITKDYNAKTAVPMLKDINYYKSLNKPHGADTDTRDHEQSPHRNIQGNLQKPEFSKKKYQKLCKFINKPEGCKNGSRCLFRHETYDRQRPNKRMKLGSVDSPAADESSLHSSCHISTDASCKINKPFGFRMAVEDVDSPAADDESYLHSSYHISTDASWKRNKPSGLGVSIKDGNGHLLEAWSDCKRDLPSSLVAEAFALRWALSESLQRKWDNIRISSDCKTLVDCINGANRCPSSCRVVYDDIILLKSNFRSCVVSFVPRSYNVHAHKLAHIGTSLAKKVCVKVLSLDGFSSIGG